MAAGILKPANTISETVDAWVAQGKVDPYICQTFELKDAVEAMRVLQNRQAIGKVVVLID